MYWFCVNNPSYTKKIRHWTPLQDYNIHGHLCPIRLRHVDYSADLSVSDSYIARFYYQTWHSSIGCSPVLFYPDYKNWSSINCSTLYVWKYRMCGTFVEAVARILWGRKYLSISHQFLLIRTWIIWRYVEFAWDGIEYWKFLGKVYVRSNEIQVSRGSGSIMKKKLNLFQISSMTGKVYVI